MKKTRLAIVATHPIQYQVPWFQGLAARSDVELKVYFALLPDPAQQGGGFGVPFQWDIPMLEGYAWEALENTRSRPDLARFFGSSTPGIYQVLDRERPDAVIITGWNAWPLLQALWACEQLRIPRIVRGESNALRARPAWVTLMHRALLSRFDAFLAIGKSNDAFYRGSGVDGSRIFLAPYFVDNARFGNAAAALIPERARLRGEWGIPEAAVCFLFAGKLEPKKRILDLVRAMAVIGGNVRPAHLLVAGTGVLLEEARALAAREGVRASFAGFLNQTELPRAYAAADCLVLPSDYGETWGLVVNEAMACGLPVVVSDRVGCGPDLVEQGVTGRVFPFGDIAALADALGSFIQNESFLREMGERARAKVGAYSVGRAVEATANAVHSIIGR